VLKRRWRRGVARCVLQAERPHLIQTPSANDHRRSRDEIAPRQRRRDTSAVWTRDVETRTPRRWGTVHAHIQGISEDKAHFRSAQERQQAGKLIGKPTIVGIEEGDEFPARDLKSAIACGVRAATLIVFLA
jgi:hypothetical protein